MANKIKLAVGKTTDNVGHVHKYTIHSDNTVTIHDAIHPLEARVRHNHVYVGTWPNGYISNNKSACHPHCEELYNVKGVDYHAHGLIVNEQIRGGLNMATNYIYQDTGQPYTGKIVKVGETIYSSPDGAYNGNSRVLTGVKVGRGTPNMRNNTQRYVSRNVRTTAGTRLTNTSMGSMSPSRVNRGRLSSSATRSTGTPLTTMRQRNNITRNNRIRNNRNNMQSQRVSTMNRTTNRTQTRQSSRTTPMRRSGGGRGGY